MVAEWLTLAHYHPCSQICPRSHLFVGWCSLWFACWWIRVVLRIAVVDHWLLCLSVQTVVYRSVLLRLPPLVLDNENKM
jgi:hypothetical protein